MALYFLVMGLGSGSWSYTLNELIKLRYWIIALVAGFSAQVGLFVYAKDCNKNVSGKTTAAGATTSSIAMLACCAHHVTDILPIIGLSILSTLLAKYQQWFLAAAVLSNIVGIIIMIGEIRRIK